MHDESVPPHSIVAKSFVTVMALSRDNFLSACPGLLQNERFIAASEGVKARKQNLQQSKHDQVWRSILNSKGAASATTGGGSQVEAAVDAPWGRGVGGSGGHPVDARDRPRELSRQQTGAKLRLFAARARGQGTAPECVLEESGGGGECRVEEVDVGDTGGGLSEPKTRKPRPAATVGADLTC